MQHNMHARTGAVQKGHQTPHTSATAAATSMHLRGYLGAPGLPPVGSEAVQMPVARPLPRGVCAKTVMPCFLHSASVPSSAAVWSIREYSTCTSACTGTV